VASGSENEVTKTLVSFWSFCSPPDWVQTKWPNYLWTLI